MKTKLLFFILPIFLCAYSIGYGQKIHQEVGAIAGPVMFKSDYGLRSNSPTNFSNVGVGIGFVHYLNFSGYYSKNNFFNNHFKFRTDVDYHVTNLNHKGKYVKKNTLSGLKLRSMHGRASVIEIGSALEFYLLNIRDFSDYGQKFAIYGGIGAHFVIFDPDTSTDLPGIIGTPDNTYYKFVTPEGEEPYIDDNPGTTYSIVLNGGIRYKLTRISDILLEGRIHYYGSDYIDGLDHNNPENKYNDWIFWLNIGYVFYID